MAVVPFPKAAQDRHKARKKTRTVDASQRITTGSFEYTCPHCGNKHTFAGQGFIFKCIEFFCNACGVKNKVSNPALK